MKWNWRGSSEKETFAFYSLLTNFQQNCINEPCGKKKQWANETPYSLNHMNDVVNYWVCTHKPTPQRYPLLLTTLKCIQIHFNVMSWIRYVIVFLTLSQPHFIYLVHLRAGLQSKICSPYSTEDNFYSKHWRLHPVYLWHMHLTWKTKTQINISSRIKLSKVRGFK